MPSQQVEYMVDHSDSDLLFFDTVFLPTVVAIYPKLTRVEYGFLWGCFPCCAAEGVGGFWGREEPNRVLQNRPCVI